MVLSEQHNAVLNGFVNIVTMEMTQTPYTEKFKPTVGGFRLVYSEVIPVRMKAAHYVALKEPTFLQKSVNAWCSLFQRWKFLELRSRIHYVEKVEDALRQLRDYGFSEQHLPKQFNGSAQPEKWYHDRVELERERYAFLQTDNNSSNDIVVEDSKVPATKSSKDQDNSDRQRLLKRKMEEVHEHNKIQMKKFNVSKLKSRQAALLDEQRMLEAQWTCTRIMTKRYETEKALIWNLLKNLLEHPDRIVATVPNLSPEMVMRCLEGRRLDPLLLTAYEYNGRNLLTGQLMFQRIVSVSVSMDERAIVEQILLCLPDLLASKGGTHNRTADLSDESFVNLGGQEASEQTLEKKLAELQSRVTQLKHSQERLHQESDFLRAGHELAQCWEEQFLEFKERQLDSLSQLVGQVLCEQTRLPLSALQGAHHPQVVAEYLLSKNLWFPGLQTHGLTADLLELTLFQEGYLVPRPDAAARQQPSETFAEPRGVLDSSSTGTSSVADGSGGKKKEGVEQRRQKVQKRRKQHLRRL